MSVAFKCRNSKGIQAGCADCHVPKPLSARLVRKTIALKDLYHTMLGSIDTPEKFAAKKQHLAERVWERMRAADSRECRNCHHLEQMDFDRQTAVGRKQHREAIQLQKTCIDCHKGVAHKLANAVNRDHNAEQEFLLE
ncbi:MAG: NapC/NirT family cytochrome c [Gammaproteobacteria bacterium]